MAGLWETVRESARAAVFGPAPSPYIAPVTAPLDRRSAVFPYPVIPNHAPDVGAYVRAGGLVHGPGATDILRRAYEQGYDLGAVASICLFRLMTDFPQAPLTVYRVTTGDRRDPVPDHPLVRLLGRPNPAWSRTQLWSWTTYVYNAHGNAYWRKIRAGDPDTGNVIEVWPVSPERCVPVREKGSANFIDYYLHKWGASRSEEQRIAPHNMVHFKFGPSDANHMVGISRLRRVLREICTDEQAARFMLNILSNNAVIGGVAVLPPEVTLTTEQKEEMKAALQARYSGDNVGSWGVIDGGGKLETIGFDPKQLDLSVLTNQAEALICAVLGVPAQVAGIPAGLEHQTFANFDQAQESYVELTLLPQYAEHAETIDHQLLPDFSARPDESAGFDTRQMRALQEDQGALSTRVMAQWLGDLITQDQALSALGMDPIGGARGPQYYSQTQALGQTPAPDAVAQAVRAALHLERRSLGEAAFADRLLALREDVAAEYGPILARHFESTRKRVMAKVGAAS